MKKVTIIGTGSMGAVLAEILLRNHYEVTIWNRTPEKARHLLTKGAIMRENVSDAIYASEVIIACVSNYESA